MKKYLQMLVLAVLVLVSLSACQWIDSQEDYSKVTSVTTEKPSKKATKEEVSSEPENQTKVDYNGSYYSVEGKYGSIIIVNKKYPLASDYNPGEDITASQAFQRLLADMQAMGFPVSSQYSGFRSYDTQAGLYENYAARDGQLEADRYSARPGHSEHQTGLAYDFIDTNGELLTEKTSTTWLAENAHHYGFIVRYLPGKEAITGYMPETWHVRYIGDEAEDIYESGLTLEEYLGIEGGDYLQ